MELALTTDGTRATLRVLGRVSMAETAVLSEYLRVARENGAVRCVLDLAECSELPTTIVAVLQRESARLSEAGGALALTGVAEQNPFLRDAVTAERFLHFRSVDDAFAGDGRETEKGSPPETLPTRS
jgi:anti-anti-sigma regulatory factor